MKNNTMYPEDNDARAIATQLAGYGGTPEGEGQARAKYGPDGFATVQEQARILPMLFTAAVAGLWQRGR